MPKLCLELSTTTRFTSPYFMNAIKCVEIFTHVFRQQDIHRSSFVTSTCHQSTPSFSWTSGLLTKDTHFHRTPPSIVECNSQSFDTTSGRAMHIKSVTTAVAGLAGNYAKHYSGSTSKTIRKAVVNSTHQSQGTSSVRHEIPCLFPMDEDEYILPQYGDSAFRCPVTFDFWYDSSVK